jgi:hypothetical protein
MHAANASDPAGLAKNQPVAVTALEAVYGPPSQAGFGSAVFHAVLPESERLADAALAQYRSFVGPLWERYGESAWLGPWRKVYARSAGAAANLVAELRAIADPAAQLAIPWILEPGEQAEAAGPALAGAFDDPVVTELRVFTLGDGGAMSGLLIAGRRAATGDATFLVWLMD